MVRKADAQSEDVIPAELIDSILDDGEGGSRRVPVTLNLRDVLTSLQLHLEQAVAEEVSRAEQNFSTVVDEMQARLAAAQEAMMLLRQERDMLLNEKEEFARTMETLRGLVERKR